MPSWGTFALGVVMFDQTRSPLLTALVMFGRPLVQLVTSRYLLASSDLLRPRTAMMMTGVVAACVDSIQVIPSLPWWMRFVLVAVMHSALAATIALLSDIVPKEAFVLGRANAQHDGEHRPGRRQRPRRHPAEWLAPTNLFLISAGAAVVAVIGTRIGLQDYRPTTPAAAAPAARRTVPRVRPLHPPIVLAALLGGLAAIGYAAALPLQERLVVSIDLATKGQAFGLLSTGTMVGQAAGALLIGGIADVVEAAAAMTIAPVLAIITSLILMPALRGTMPADDKAVAMA